MYSGFFLYFLSLSLYIPKRMCYNTGILVEFYV